jgi:hypothetical protein
MNFVVTGGTKGTDWTYSKNSQTGIATLSFLTASNYTLTFPKVNQPLDYVVVGGGGGGGCRSNTSGGSSSGGGGGGQVLQGNLTLSRGTSYNISVGSGGAPGVYLPDNNSSIINLGVTGGLSSIDSLVVANGGGGGHYTSDPVANVPGAGGLGGNGSGTIGKGGSGASTNQTGFNGENGVFVTLNNTYYGGGGGGGGGYPGVGTGGAGGLGGGGIGGSPGDSSTIPTSGTPNTGGGGGSGAIRGITEGGNGGSGVVIFSFTPIYPYPCFKEGSKILTDKGYRKVEELRKGDLIQTFSNGLLPIDMIGTSEMYNSGDDERIKDRLYTCSRLRYRDLFEDLVITGCHSVLVNDFKDDNEANKTKEILGGIYSTDKHYRLPACVDQRSIPYPVKGTFNIYHIALENDDYYGNYGVYANGLLVETCSKRYLKELSNMKLIE